MTALIPLVIEYPISARSLAGHSCLSRPMLPEWLLETRTSSLTNSGLRHCRDATSARKY